MKTEITNNDNDNNWEMTCVKSNAESNACLTQQQASKQDDSIQLQGKQQVSTSDRVLRHQGASCAAPQKRENTAVGCRAQCIRGSKEKQRSNPKE